MHNDSCKHCGHCPHCGQPMPPVSVQPYYPWTPYTPYPIVIQPTIIPVTEKYVGTGYPGVEVSWTTCLSNN